MILHRKRRAALGIACIALLVSGWFGAGPVRAVSATGGVELDGYGNLTAFGGNTVNTAAAPHWTWDIARAVALNSDGLSGWTLDGWGGIHAFAGAPAITSHPYWSGWDIARALVILPGTASGYELDGWGGVHSVGGAPALGGFPYWQGSDYARGLDIHLDVSGTPDGGATLDKTGALHPWGNYPYSLHATTYPGRDAFLSLHSVSGHVYAVGRYGAIVEQTTGSAMTPLWTGYVDWGNRDRLRDLVVTSPAGGTTTSPPMSFMAQQGWLGVIGPRGGVTLDGWGGLHPFGGLPLNTNGNAFWRGWDIARGVAVLPDATGGWTLDGFGGVHAFGAAQQPTAYPYWHGYDIARAVVINPDRHSGYELDGWGGVHAIGGAPALSGYAYWPGIDVARGLAIHYTDAGAPDGGWTLDSWGNVHAFGAAPSNSGAQQWSGRNMYEQLNATYSGALYVVGRWGVLTNVSGRPLRPYWSGYGDWGSWDIIRDVVLFGADNASVQAQPISWGASGAYWTHIWVYSFNIAPVAQGLPLDCESAALEEATRAKGNGVSQYSIFNSLPQQPGSAVWSGNEIAQWGDPYQAFVGNVYGSESRATGYGVYDPPLVAVAKHFGFNAVGIEGGSPNQVFTYLAMGDPVLIITSYTWTPVATHWWHAYDGRSIPYSLTDHAVTIVGVNAVAGTVTINDVGDGRLKTFSIPQFISFWTTYLDMAVVLV